MLGLLFCLYNGIVFYATCWASNLMIHYLDARSCWMQLPLQLNKSSIARAGYRGPSLPFIYLSPLKNTTRHPYSPYSPIPLFPLFPLFPYSPYSPIPLFPQEPQRNKRQKRKKPGPSTTNRASKYNSPSNYRVADLTIMASLPMRPRR